MAKDKRTGWLAALEEGSLVLVDTGFSALSGKQYLVGHVVRITPTGRISVSTDVGMCAVYDAQGRRMKAAFGHFDKLVAFRGAAKRQWLAADLLSRVIQVFTTESVRARIGLQTLKHIDKLLEPVIKGEKVP